MLKVQTSSTELETTGSIAAPDSLVDSIDSESVYTNLKGRFSRRWTHNEQLFVRCCGIIISRATFYGSEGVSGVKVRREYYHCIFSRH